MCHCQRRGAQLILGRDAHLHLYEHGGAAQVGAAGGQDAARAGGARWHPAAQGQEGGLLLPSAGCRAGPGRGALAGLRRRQHPHGAGWGLSKAGAGREGAEGQRAGTPVHHHPHPPPAPASSPISSALCPARAQVAGVHSQALPDLPDGTFDLERLELTIREAHGSRYHPRPELICLENTHSSAGGRALPLTYLQQVGASGWQQPWARAARPGRTAPRLCRGARGTAHVGAGCPSGLGASGGPSRPSCSSASPRSVGSLTATGCGCTWMGHG